MQDFSISVIKLTSESLMRRACEMTFNGESHQSLSSIYKSEHSPARTQLFWIEAKHIPLFISTHLLRHHVGSVPFQLTCRDDRDGGNNNFKGRVDDVIKAIQSGQNASLDGDWMTSGAYLRSAEQSLDALKETADRYTPVNLGLLVNAQSLIDMAKLRLCNQAHKETIEVFLAIREKVAEVDVDLAVLMVPKCVYRGGLCGEPMCCGYNSTNKFLAELRNYVAHFSQKQMGLVGSKMLKIS